MVLKHLRGKQYWVYRNFSHSCIHPGLHTLLMAILNNVEGILDVI